MGLLQDAKNILLGNTDDMYQLDFKEEIENALKAGIITKAEAAELIQTRNHVKADAKELDKKQISSISLEDGTTVSYEEAKARKEELERKKREKEAQKKNALENARSQTTKQKIDTKNQTQKNKLSVDRNKMIQEMEKDEKGNITKNTGRDEKI